ncbi:PIN domain-containing protein [uncultured Roseobacter sp.]|uniref:PIN domain-containing protein n=1 Tax=uncultured Roseobacter sp. TaxID=114847 RepID=UPI0026186CB9|nr:PIN domain-containing protein [uncultured Roseobacter sp.]
MSYDAITIDTQPVHANNLDLTSGLIGQLDQYKDGLVEFIISDVNVREIHKALTDKAKAPREALSNAIKKGLANDQLTDAQQTDLQNIHQAMAKPEEHAYKQLSDFLAKTGAEVIKAERVKHSLLLDKYFKNEPPFASKGKKNEFPDAIALLSLEDWAVENRKKILAVSNDGDWKSFAEKSDHLDVIDDLGKAMSRLNTLAEETMPAARSVLRSISNKDKDTIDRLETNLVFAVENEAPYIEFDGSMPGEEDGASLSLISYEVEGLEDGTSDIDIVRVGTNTFAFRVPISIKALLYVEISFSIRDSIDKDYVPMGAKSIEQEIEFDAFLLIKCSKFPDVGDDEDDQKMLYEIDDVQLLGAPSSIDIGYIDYSLAEDDYDFELEKLYKEVATDI